MQTFSTGSECPEVKAGRSLSHRMRGCKRITVTLVANTEGHADGLVFLFVLLLGLEFRIIKFSSTNPISPINPIIFRSLCCKGFFRDAYDMVAKITVY